MDRRFKFLAVLVALALAAAVLAGCSAETTEETGGGGEGGGGQETTQPAKWVKVATLKGSSEKQSAPFTLKGGEQKLVYKVTGDKDFATAAIYIEKAGTDLNTEGGFPVVTVDKPGKDTTYLSKDAGRYQFIVMSANCDWTLTLYEKR